MRAGTYVFETFTSSIACSKECRGGVAVDAVEDVWGYCDSVTWWYLEGGAFIVRHTIAGLRAVVIAKTLLNLSSPRLITTYVGDASINDIGGRV